MSIPNGPSALAVKEAAWGLARYAAISQVSQKSSNYYVYATCYFLYDTVYLWIATEKFMLLCVAGQWIGANCGARNLA